MRKISTRDYLIQKYLRLLDNEPSTEGIWDTENVNGEDTIVTLDREKEQKFLNHPDVKASNIMIKKLIEMYGHESYFWDDIQEAFKAHYAGKKSNAVYPLQEE